MGLSALGYIYQSIRRPRLRPFLRMGAGIGARYERCASYWEKHLELCKSFQAAAFSGCSQRRSLAILGAGRLLDADPAFLRSAFGTVRLYDADPLARESWRATALRAAEAHCIDLTGCFDFWRESFRPEGNSPEDFARGLAELTTPDPSKLVEPADCVLSLNILSQIPLYWRDHVEEMANRAGISRDGRGEYPEPLERALVDSMRKLQEQHLTLLSAVARQSVVLVCDTEFMYYRKDHEHWQVERALFAPLEPLETRFDRRLHDSWLWHIAPQDVEQPDYGQIHRVEAWSFARKV